MIVDSGEYVFLWLGGGASEVEIKLAYKAAQVYCGHIQMKQPDKPRKLASRSPFSLIFDNIMFPIQKLSIKERESQRFTRLFHGWGKHKAAVGAEGK
jgi:hypothetical protein